jgi:hypothetical protein
MPPLATDLKAAWPAPAHGRCMLPTCRLLGTDAQPLLPCDACDLGIHRECAGFSVKAHAWNRGFICEICRVTRLDQPRELAPSMSHAGLGKWDVHKRRKLMRAANVITSRAWADSSWGAMAYHLRKVIVFEEESGIPTLPMGLEQMMMYFTHLIETSPTHRAVRSARTAIRAWHIVAGLKDPFLDEEWKFYLTGLTRTVTLYSKKKLGLKLDEWLKLFHGSMLDAKTPIGLRLRDAAWLICGFFGFRRHSEVVICNRATEEKGLRQCDVHFYPQKRRVRLFIRRMKNDRFGKGHFIWLCDRTTSGVPLYDTLRHYADVSGHDAMSTLPFIQGTCGPGKFDGRPLLQYRSRLKVLMRRHLAYLSEAELRDYSAHSLRRGGVTHAYNAHVHWDLLHVHAGWLGGPAITGYRFPDDDKLCSVTEAM